MGSGTAKYAVLVNVSSSDSIMPIFFQSTRCLCSEQALLCLSLISHCLLFPFGTCLMVREPDDAAHRAKSFVLANMSMFLCQCVLHNGAHWPSCTLFFTTEYEPHCNSQALYLPSVAIIYIPFASCSSSAPQHHFHRIPPNSSTPPLSEPNLNI